MWQTLVRSQCFHIDVFLNLRYPYYQQGMAQYAAANGGQSAMYGAPPPYQNQMLGLRKQKKTGCASFLSLLYGFAIHHHYGLRL